MKAIAAAKIMITDYTIPTLTILARITTNTSTQEDTMEMKEKKLLPDAKKSIQMQTQPTLSLNDNNNNNNNNSDNCHSDDNNMNDNNSNNNSTLSSKGSLQSL